MTTDRRNAFCLLEKLYMEKLQLDNWWHFLLILGQKVEVCTLEAGIYTVKWMVNPSLVIRLVNHKDQFAGPVVSMGAVLHHSFSSYFGVYRQDPSCQQSVDNRVVSRNQDWCKAS